jgi:inosine/xanthosine triphosphate pyrophosphatase family protein
MKARRAVHERHEKHERRPAAFVCFVCFVDNQPRAMIFAEVSIGIADEPGEEITP